MHSKVIHRSQISYDLCKAPRRLHGLGKQGFCRPLVGTFLVENSWWIYIALVSSMGTLRTCDLSLYIDFDPAFTFSWLISSWTAMDVPASQVWKWLSFYLTSCRQSALVDHRVHELIVARQWRFTSTELRWSMSCTRLLLWLGR